MISIELGSSVEAPLPKTVRQLLSAPLQVEQMRFRLESTGEAR